MSDLKNATGVELEVKRLRWKAEGLRAKAEQLEKLAERIAEKHKLGGISGDDQS